MTFKFESWAAFPRVGNAYAGDIDGRWCTILEILEGAYRGDHIHKVRQYGVLLSGKIMVVSFIDGKFLKKIMEKDQISVTEPGIPHISIALEDSVSYEWWDGPYESTPCPGVFDEYKKNRVGPADYSD